MVEPWLLRHYRHIYFKYWVTKYNDNNDIKANYGYYVDPGPHLHGISLTWHLKLPIIFRASHYSSIFCTSPTSNILLCLELQSLKYFFFRDLLKQHRVKLHINFFISLMLNGTISILWYMLVHHDLLIKPSTEAVMYLNPVSSSLTFKAWVLWFTFTNKKKKQYALSI